MKATACDIARTGARRASAGVLALLLLSPVLRAQDSAAAAPATASPAPDAAAGYRTHTVRPGETLYDLAERYLGDGDLWPEIYRANAGVIQDPHWLYTNEVLRIPAAGNASAMAMTATPAAGASDTAAAPATKAVAAAPMAPAASAASAPEESGSGASTTLFNHSGETRTMFTSSRYGPSAARPHPGVHPDERFAAPYLDRDGGPKGSGAVVGTIDESNVVNAAARAHYDLQDDIYITLPAGSTAAVGDRFYTYDLGVSFGERGQIVIPTAILTVRQPGAGTDATIARVTTLFGVLHLGQRVLPVDSPQLPTGRPTRVDDGVRMHVAWVENDAVLPSVQHYVVLDATPKQDLHIGDQVTLYRPRVHLPESTVTLPESIIAVAEIVRVNPYSATALVLSQTQPAILAGDAARVTARMP